MRKLALAVLSAGLMFASSNVLAQKTVEELLNGIQIAPSAMIRYLNANPVVVYTYDENGDVESRENFGQRTTVNAVVDIAFTKEYESGAILFLNLEYGANTQETAINMGVPVRMWGDLNWFTAYDGVTELHITQPLFDNKVSVLFGKFYVDSFFSENEVSGDFENGVFNPSGLYTSIYIDEIGDALYGGAVKISLIEYIDISYQYQIRDIDKVGWDYNAVELTFKLPIENKEGNYRIGYWQNNEVGLQKYEVVDGEAQPKNRASASGLSVSIDQKIIEGIGIFGRYGMPITETEINKFASFGFGLVINGTFWTRADDSIGIGFGQITPTGAFADEKFGDDTDKSYKSETHFEFYYNLKVSDFLSLIPSIQYIGNPEGASTIDPDKTEESYIDSIIVFGVRAAISF